MVSNTYLEILEYSGKSWADGLFPNRGKYKSVVGQNNDRRTKTRSGTMVSNTSSSSLEKIDV